MDFNSVLSWLKGSQGTNENLAPPLASYPSNDDADYARKYQYGYGSGNEPYLNNERARVVGQQFPSFAPGQKGQKVLIPDSAEGMGLSQVAGLGNTSPMVDLTTPGNKGIQSDVNNLMMRAALAANRSPVASVGFDPSKVALDTVLPKMGDPIVGGVFNPKSDSMYSVAPEDSITHEATHRGLAQLRKAYPEAMGTLESSLPSNEEMTVRYLMKTHAGDPEATHGPVAQEQRETANRMYNDPFTGDQRQNALKQVEGLAALYNKEKNPRGPR